MNPTHALSAQWKKQFLTSEEEITPYLKDWSEWKGNLKSNGVFLPRSTKEISQFLKYCYTHHLKVVPSGGRTGLCGGAIASSGELILSLEKMNHILEIDPYTPSVTVEAGVINQKLQEKLAPHFLEWTVDLPARGSCQVGGNLATNAGGIQALNFGMAKRTVLGLEVVLADGTILEMGCGLEKNNTGPDLMNLFLGSEGIFGVITKATLKLQPLVQKSSLYLLLCNSVEDALSVLKTVRNEFGLRVLAFEFSCKHSKELVSQYFEVPSFFKESGEYFIILKTAQDLEKQTLFEEYLAEKAPIVSSLKANSAKEEASFWMIRENVTESLKNKGMVHKQDVTLKISDLAGFILEWKSLLKKDFNFSDTESFVFGHVGDGNLHLNYCIAKDYIATKDKIDQAVYAMVARYQGSISAEHGIGLLKKQHLSKTRSEEEIKLIQKLKNILDSRNILNPGKVLPDSI